VRWRTTHKTLCLLFVATLLHGADANAAKEDEADDFQELKRTFERIRGESFLGPDAADLNFDDLDLLGNPLKEKVKGWPEDLVVAPVPGYSPQLGWTLKLAAGYFMDPRNPESKSPASIIGGGAMFSENGSTAFALGTYLHLMDDKLRVVFGAGKADVRYRYFINDVLGSGQDIGVDVEQDGPLYFTKATWRVWKKMYLGVGYMAGSVNTSVRRPPDFLPELPDDISPSVKFDIGAYIIPMEIDSRDDTNFPRSGWKIDGVAKFFRESAGSDFDAGVYKLNFNHYRPMRENDTLATRLIMKSSDGDAPFFLLSTFGGSTDLRGYPSGRYRDRKMYALQTEYRWHFNDRWIFTGFAGFGEVAERFKDFGDDFLPATGVGVRFVLSKKHKVSLSSDIAVGNDGVEFYFGVGEAF
jgi:hypothetical protein